MRIHPVARLAGRRNTLHNIITASLGASVGSGGTARAVTRADPEGSAAAVYYSNEVNQQPYADGVVLTRSGYEPTPLRITSSAA